MARNTFRFDVVYVQYYISRESIRPLLRSRRIFFATSQFGRSSYCRVGGWWEGCESTALCLRKGLGGNRGTSTLILADNRSLIYHRNKEIAVLYIQPDRICSGKNWTSRNAINRLFDVYTSKYIFSDGNLEKYNQQDETVNWITAYKRRTIADLI